MEVVLGADHRGFSLKEKIKEALRAEGYDVRDIGAETLDSSDDYPRYALRVAKEVAKAPQLRRGVVLCGSGVGVDIVANKVKGIRSALAFRREQARAARKDDDTNVIALPADYLSEDEAIAIVKDWLETPFSGEERHRRRIAEISAIEEGT
jgi:ribose 5-phosphate isomerase B